MTYVITDECIMCGCCKSFCRCGAIYEDSSKYVVDQTRCNSCGICLDYCAIDAIVPEGYVKSTASLN